MAGSRLIRRIQSLWSSLFERSLVTSRRSTRQLTSEVQVEETLTSFVTRQDQIVRKATIHHSRLMPRRNPKTKRLEVSVCRSSSLSERQVWTICADYFDCHAPTPAIGRGVGPASTVYGEKLEFDADGEPYPEHANIIGWHDETGRSHTELKSYWTDKAQRMALQFKYIPRT
jgi:hypothetical protein